LWLIEAQSPAFLKTHGPPSETMKLRHQTAHRHVDEIVAALPGCAGRQRSDCVDVELRNEGSEASTCSSAPTVSAPASDDAWRC
jgi:hypothetical protein